MIGLLVSGAGALPASAHGPGRQNGQGWHNQEGRQNQQGPQNWGGHGRRGHGHGTSGTFTNTVFASGAVIMHPVSGSQAAVSNPDDITYLDGHIFVGFQNGVGPQGQASTTGNAASTIVEFDRRGHEVNQWDIVGKCDGLTADPDTHSLIATVNEDWNSSLYVIALRGGGTVVHYAYDDVPLPHNGGTDAISIFRGMILISASAPGTMGAAAPQSTYPAVYRVVLDAATDVANVYPLFYDEAPAKVANRGNTDFGTTASLALTDPDSNEVVPSYAPRFRGDFMLTSQGDQQQIFVRDPGRWRQSLSVVNLSDSVDDTVWPSEQGGAIFTTDNSNNTINEITGPFSRGEVFVADTPCDSNNALSTCPAPGFPANFLGQLNPDTGVITPVTVQGLAFEPQEMLFLP